MSDMWESLAIWMGGIVGGLVLLLIALITFHSWLDNRQDKYVEEWFRNFGCAETTGEILIVRSHKKGGSWLSGFLNIIRQSKGKAPVQGSRRSSSGSLAATSSALVGRVIRPTRSTPSSIAPSSDSSTSKS